MKNEKRRKTMCCVNIDDDERRHVVNIDDCNN